jgi:hypothetical protein
LFPLRLGFAAEPVVARCVAARASGLDNPTKENGTGSMT